MSKKRLLIQELRVGELPDWDLNAVGILNGLSVKQIDQILKYTILCFLLVALVLPSPVF